MSTEIKNLDGKIIATTESDTLRGVDLSYANLHGADLAGADLEDADLRDADLRNADLQNADLRGSNLQNADLQNAYLRNADLQNADLQNADLRDTDLRNADLRNADLQNADLQDANLQDANLYGCKLPKIIPSIPNVYQVVLTACGESGDLLNMRNWHSECGTTHCIAGWVVTLAGDRGKALGDELGTSTAAALIIAKSDDRYPVPNFYTTRQEALDMLNDRSNS